MTWKIQNNCFFRFFKQKITDSSIVANSISLPLDLISRKRLDSLNFWRQSSAALWANRLIAPIISFEEEIIQLKRQNFCRLATKVQQQESLIASGVAMAIECEFRSLGEK